MRRVDRQITDSAQLFAVMEGCAYVIVAMNDETAGVPYMVTLNFGMEVKGDAVFLYMHSAMEGKKTELLRQDGRVRFFMVQEHGTVYDAHKRSCTMNYESVSGIGEMREVCDTAQKKHALDVLMRHYYPKDMPPYDERVIAMTKVYCLHVEALWGKKREKR